MASESRKARLSLSSSSAAAASKRYQSRSDLFALGDEEVHGGDDESGVEFMCPFCAEDFDIVGLCCHIDEEHPIEAMNWVCPVCAKRVGMDIVGHITMQHGSFFKVQRKRRLRKGGSNSTLSMLKKEMHLQSLLDGSSWNTSSNTEPDPLLSSFIFNQPLLEQPETEESLGSTEAGSVEKNSEEHYTRKVEALQISDKDHEETTRKCEFAQGLFFSAMFDDIL